MTDYIEWILKLIEEDETREGPDWRSEAGSASLRGKAGRTAGRRPGTGGNPCCEPLVRGAPPPEASRDTARRGSERRESRRPLSLTQPAPVSGVPKAAAEMGAQPWDGRAAKKAISVNGDFLTVESGGIFAAITQRGRQVRQSESLGLRAVWPETRAAEGASSTADPAALDLVFQRDARRYDGAFTLY